VAEVRSVTIGVRHGINVRFAFLAERGNYIGKALNPRGNSMRLECCADYVGFINRGVQSFLVFVTATGDGNERVISVDPLVNGYV
jgi:hypothetical protein